jgi:hypothetical protein
MIRKIAILSLFCTFILIPNHVVSTTLQISRRVAKIQVHITSPQANAAWKKRQSHQIKWDKVGQPSQTVRIVLSNPDGTQPIRTIADPAPNIGSYQWTVPGYIPQGRYKIMVSLLGTQISGMSEEFSILDEDLKAIPVDLSSKQVIVKNPQENRRYEPGAAITIEWETDLPRDITSTADVLFFDIDVYNANGANKIYPIAKKEHWRSYHQGGNRYRTTWNWNPTEGNQAIRTGFYKIKITPKYAAGNIGGVPGLSGKIHLSRGLEKHGAEMRPKQIRNRFARKQEYFTVSREPGPGTIPIGDEKKPGTARVGFHNEYRQGVEAANDYAYKGFVYRSQVIFPLESYKKPGRLLVKAELRLTANSVVMRVNRHGGCAGILYYLTGPWEGKCLDTPGYRASGIPDLKVCTLDVTQYVQNWFTGSQPNHGFIIAGVNEKFVHNSKICVSWYEAILIIEYLEENKY